MRINYYLLLLCSMVSLLTINSSFSQSSKLFKSHLAFEIGTSLSTMTDSDAFERYDQSFKSVPGIHLGVHYGFKVSKRKRKFIEIGVTLTSKGYSAIREYSDGNGTFTLKAKYVQVPFSYTAHFPINRKTSLVTGIGAYLGYGVQGTGKVVFKGETHEEAISWGDEKDNHYNPIDAGLSVKGGIKHGVFSFNIAYYLGLANASISGETLQNKNHRQLIISVTYDFLQMK